jgi:O-antigen/teichoic acid export membrane protein
VRSIRNAARIAASLVLTGGLGLAMRLVLPRWLGPSALGELSFADAFAATFFVALGASTDGWMRNQVSLRPEPASDVFAGLTALRILVSAALVGAMALVMSASGRPAQVRTLVWIYAAAQFCVITSSSLASMLQSRGMVHGMSVTAVVTKVMWVAGVLAAILLGLGLWAFAASFLLSEATEMLVLFWLARRHVDLKVRFRRTAVAAMLVWSLPLLLRTTAGTVYGKMDVNYLALVAGNDEVGWYGAASSLSVLTLIAMPLITSVLMPLLVRANDRSEVELWRTVRRALEMILTIAIPIALALALGADLWVRVAFGAAFAQAAPALRVLAFVLVVTVANTLLSVILTVRSRVWVLAAISFVGMGFNLVFNLLLVRQLYARLGAGGGGFGAALALLATEAVILVANVAVLKGACFDRRSALVLAKTAVACAIVFFVDRGLAFLGPARLLVDGLAYLSLVLGARALAVGELKQMVQMALGRPAPTKPGLTQ